MSAFESRVSFQETSKFYSLVLHRVLTKSDRLPARLLCAGASPSGSTQPNQTEVFLCSVCVDAQVFPCPSSQPCVCSGTFKMWTFGKVQWAATTTGVIEHKQSPQNPYSCQNFFGLHGKSHHPLVWLPEGWTDKQTKSLCSLKEGTPDLSPIPTFDIAAPWGTKHSSHFKTSRKFPEKHG